MEPMKPMDTGPAWWPEHLGSPATSGGQNQMRYAFFPEHRRLAVREGDRVTIYDTGDHDITGASQRQGSGQTLTFVGENGEVRLSELKEVD